MLKRFIMAMLTLCIAGATIAQNTFLLVGNVADTKGEALPFANCVLLHEADSSFAYGTTGDMEGRFSIGNIGGGNYLLRITFMGYLPYWQRLEIDNDIDLGNIALDKNSTLLKEVEITASRPLYSADGEKVFYNVGDDPSVQSGCCGPRA